MKVVFQTFLFVVCLSLPLAYGYDSPRRTDSSKRNWAKATSEYKIDFVINEIKKNHFARNWCANELNAINSIGNQFQNYLNSENTAINTAKKYLLGCIREIANKAMDIQHPISKESWYSQHLAGQEYLKDFEHYSELEDQFKGKMDRAYRQYRNLALMTEMGVSIFSIPNYIANHPHLKENHTHHKETLPYEYNTFLTELKKAKTCTTENTKSCFENLKNQLAEDSEDTLKGMCNKALREGQACCANPNRSCGDFAFAKDISKTFAQNLPGVSQAFANLATIQGNAAKACQLSQLGAVVGPLGSLQLNSCNKAIDGCRETCQTRLDKFKQEFKKCYNISEKESLSEVIRKASLETEEEEDDDADPRSGCQNQIKELAEAYKQSSLESRYSLKEDSDHEELVSCYGEIEKHAPGNRTAQQGGMDPTQQLAVNMCYSQLGGNPPPAGPPVMPGSPIRGSPPVSVGSFTGLGTNVVKPPASTYNEGDSPLAGMDIGDEIDGSKGMGIKPTGANELKFRSPQNEGGPGGSGALAGRGTGGSPGDGKGEGGEKEAGSTAGGIGSGKQLPFYTGDIRDGMSNGDSWGPEADAKYLRLKNKAEQLKKLPRKYLTDEEKDLVKMFSTPSKHESIFERASFAFHWFCRNYGCVGYDEDMGITYKDLDPFSFMLPEQPNALQFFK